MKSRCSCGKLIEPITDEELNKTPKVVRCMCNKKLHFKSPNVVSHDLPPCDDFKKHCSHELWYMYGMKL